MEKNDGGIFYRSDTYHEILHGITENRIFLPSANAILTQKARDIL